MLDGGGTLGRLHLTLDPEAPAMRFCALSSAAFVLALLLPGIPTAAASPAGPATPSATVDVGINECRIEGEAANIPGDALTIKHRSASGKLKRRTDVAVVAGSWVVDCPGARVRRGDRLQLFTTGASTPFRTFVVPALRLRPDRVHDRLSGNAPGGADLVQVAATRCDPSLTLCAKTLRVTVNPTGPKSAFSLATGDLTGSTLTFMQWTKGGDFVQLRQFVARMVIRPGSATVTGFGGSAGQAVTITLKRGQAIGRMTRTTGPDAAYKGTVKRAGALNKTRAGDRISGSFARDAILRVPQASLTFDFDSIDGRCFKTAPVTVLQYGVDGTLTSMDQTTSDDTGHWTVATTVLAGARIQAWCTTPKGDAVLKDLTAI